MTSIEYKHYAKQVVDFMETFPGEKIDSVTIGYSGDETSTNQYIVNVCVRHAIPKGVEQVKLISRKMLPQWTPSFPCWMFPVSRRETIVSSTLKHLHLRYFSLKPRPDFIGFHNLESLELDCTEVNKDLFESVLSNPVIRLRVLRLKNCPSEFDLKVVNPSLKHFETIDCVHLGSLTLSAIKLTVFEYHSICKLERNVFLNAPRMSDLYFHKLAENKIPALLSQSNAPQVENLNLRIVTEKILVMPRSTIQFWNLKQLELTVESIDDLEEGLDVLLVFSFLKASPLLQKLKFRRLSSAFVVCPKASKSERWKVPQDFSHIELKEVEILGCEGNWCEIELAIYVMQRAQCLDKLVFNPSTSHYPADGEWLKSFQYWSWPARVAPRNSTEKASS